MEKILFIILGLASINCFAEEGKISSQNTEIRFEVNVEANRSYGRERRVIPITTTHFVGIHNNTSAVAAIHVSYRTSPFNHPVCEIVRDINLAPGQIWRDSARHTCEVKYMRAGTKPYMSYTTVSVDGGFAKEAKAESDVIVSEY